MPSILHAKLCFVSALNNQSNTEIQEIMKYFKFLFIGVVTYLQYYFDTYEVLLTIFVQYLYSGLGSWWRLLVE